MKSQVSGDVHQERPRRWLPLLLLGTGLIVAGAVLSFHPQWLDPSGALTGTAVQVAYRAPDLVLMDLQGSRRSLTDQRGMVILVNLWATWCPPCREEMPVLQEYYEEHRSDGFEVVAINSGESQVVVSAFAVSYGLNFEVWLDQEFQAERAFGAISLPSSYLLDRKGIVRWVWVGAMDRSDLERHATPLLDES